MAMSLNKVTLAGTLVDKPMIRKIEGGQKMVGLSIVTTCRWRDTNNGEEQLSQEWHRVLVLHEDLAAFAEAKLTRDDQVYIEGELHTERWLSETFETWNLTKIVLWQQGHQLRRLPAEEREKRTLSTSQHPVLAATREAHLIEATEW